MTTPILPYDFPLTPLEFLRERIGYSPYLWWGLSNDKVIHGSACNQAIYEYAWQAADQIGRAEMREALLNAETDLQREMRFSVAPHFNEATVDYLSLNLLAQNRLYNVTQWGAGDPFARWTEVQLPEGYVNALGYEDLELLGTPSITLTDENGDGLLDTFTATVATTETDPLKLAVYFPEDERLDPGAPSERWRIQPVKISISSGLATIVGRSWTIVRPILYEKATVQQPLDPDTTANYITDVEVYTRTTNPDGTDITNCQATMIWETTPLPVYPFLCPPISTAYSTDPATVGYAVGRAGIRNQKLGEVTPAQATFDANTGKWNETFPIWQWRPDRVTVRYNAGYPLDADGQVSKKLRDATTILAISNMPQRICACDVANRSLQYYQWDMARVANNVEQYATTQQQLNNIFGTKRGQVMAWQKVKHLVLHRGVTY